MSFIPSLITINTIKANYIRPSKNFIISNLGCLHVIGFDYGIVDNSECYENYLKIVLKKNNRLHILIYYSNTSIFNGLYHLVYTSDIGYHNIEFKHDNYFNTEYMNLLKNLDLEMIKYYLNNANIDSYYRSSFYAEFNRIKTSFN